MTPLPGMTIFGIRCLCPACCRRMAMLCFLGAIRRHRKVVVPREAMLWAWLAELDMPDVHNEWRRRGDAGMRRLVRRDRQAWRRTPGPRRDVPKKMILMNQNGGFKWISAK